MTLPGKVTLYAKIILTIIKVKGMEPKPLHNEAPLLKVDTFPPSGQKLRRRNVFFPGGRNTRKEKLLKC